MDYPEYIKRMTQLIIGSMNMHIGGWPNFAAVQKTHEEIGFDFELREVHDESGGWKPLSAITTMADYTPPHVQERRNRARKAVVCVDNGYDYWKD